MKGACLGASFVSLIGAILIHFFESISMRILLHIGWFTLSGLMIIGYLKILITRFCFNNSFPSSFNYAKRCLHIFKLNAHKLSHFLKYHVNPQLNIKKNLNLHMGRWKFNE
jgi:hypothetical protein